MRLFTINTKLRINSLLYGITIIPQSSGGSAAAPAPTSAADVLANLYTFGLGLIGVSALLVLVAAGVWYMAAGDNEGRVKQARTWMGNAVFGLVLALISWLILYTINPDLTKITIGVEQIELRGPPKIVQPDQYGCTSNDTCTEGYQCVGFTQGRIPGRCISQAIENQPSTIQCGFTKEADCTTNADFCVWVKTQKSAKCASRQTPLVAAPPSVPIKSGLCGQTTCKLDPDLGNKLSGLAQKLQEANIQWRVTEAWPPTVTHAAQCHTYGTCVDANFTGTTAPSPQNIKTFIEEAKKRGALAVYEVTTVKRQNELLAAGLTRNEVIVPKTKTGGPAITAEHFSVYNLLSQPGSQSSNIQLPQQN